MLILLILGLLIVAAAAAIGAVGFLDNRGTDHTLASGFDAFGRTMHGSSGQLFIWGLVIGVAAMIGLMLFFVGVRGELAKHRAVRTYEAERVRADRRARATTPDQIPAPRDVAPLPVREPEPVRRRGPVRTTEPVRATEPERVTEPAWESKRDSDTVRIPVTDPDTATATSTTTTADTDPDTVPDSTLVTSGRGHRFHRVGREATPTTRRENTDS